MTLISSSIGLRTKSMTPWKEASVPSFQKIARKCVRKCKVVGQREPGNDRRLAKFQSSGKHACERCMLDCFEFWSFASSVTVKLLLPFRSNRLYCWHNDIIKFAVLVVKKFVQSQSFSRINTVN